MQYPQFQPSSGQPRKSRLVWILGGVIGVLVVALVIALVVLSAKSEPTAPVAPPFGTSVVATGKQAALADNYAGNSSNKTAEQLGLDGSATLELQFTNKNPATLAGNIKVTGRDVGGTGLFEGTLTGSSIKLTVLPSDGVPSFRLTGTIQADGSINGVLTVPPSAGDIAQSGVWQVQPK